MQATPLAELSQSELDELAKIYALFHEGDRATHKSVEAALKRFAEALAKESDA